jgi:transcriptional regulator with PAS, ATPase and Fis domain
MPETILESELFGHERGAFTGAQQAKQGLLEAAHGGTLFLDEIGEAPLATQAKLLRFLETGEVLRIGSVTPRIIDVRIVSATNRDPRAMIGQGTFRADLFFRLNGISLTLPPLRDRRSEILPLAEHFAARAADRLQKPRPRFSTSACDALMTHPWPGNVRELRSVVERAVLLSPDATLEVDHMMIGEAHAAAPAAGPSDATRPPTGSAPAVSGETDEKAKIMRALDEAWGNQAKAAALLGISRGTLISRLEKYAIPRPRKK